MPIAKDVSSNSGNNQNQFKEEVALLTWIKNFFPCYKDMEKSKYQEGKKKLRSELCVARLLIKMREIDRLKAILFDQEQRVLFDNLPKPDVLAPKESENALERSRRLGDNSQTLSSYHDKLACKLSKNGIDQRLLAWYEEGYPQYQ